MSLAATLKPKACAHCGREFLPARLLQRVCSPLCATRKVRKDKQAAKAIDRTRRAALETIPELIKAAQKEFNAYIRTRDRLSGALCVSSGRVLDWSGNGVDAGHYRSVGSAPHLRFNEDNCHAQSKHDNQWKSGNAVDYRLGLIQRIGLARVEALESNNAVHHWTREELRAIRDTYRAKCREMEKASA